MDSNSKDNDTSTFSTISCLEVSTTEKETVDCAVYDPLNGSFSIEAHSSYYHHQGMTPMLDKSLHLVCFQNNILHNNPHCNDHEPSKDRTGLKENEFSEDGPYFSAIAHDNFLCGCTARTRENSPELVVMNPKGYEDDFYTFYSGQDHDFSILSPETIIERQHRQH